MDAAQMFQIDKYLKATNYTSGSGISGSGKARNPFRYALTRTHSSWYTSVDDRRHYEVLEALEQLSPKSTRAGTESESESESESEAYSIDIRNMTPGASLKIEKTSEKSIGLPLFTRTYNYKCVSIDGESISFKKMPIKQQMPLSDDYYQFNIDICHGKYDKSIQSIPHKYDMHTWETTLEFQIDARLNVYFPATNVYLMNNGHELQLHEFNTLMDIFSNISAPFKVDSPTSHSKYVYINNTTAEAALKCQYYKYLIEDWPYLQNPKSTANYYQEVVDLLRFINYDKLIEIYMIAKNRMSCCDTIITNPVYLQQMSAVIAHYDYQYANYIKYQGELNLVMGTSLIPKRKPKPEPEPNPKYYYSHAQWKQQQEQQEQQEQDKQDAHKHYEQELKKQHEKALEKQRLKIVEMQVELSTLYEQMAELQEYCTVLPLPQ
jgi:hypothetical protein